MCFLFQFTFNEKFQIEVGYNIYFCLITSFLHFFIFCCFLYRSKDHISEFLSLCDYVINTLPSTPETRGMLSGDVLSACKEKVSSIMRAFLSIKCAEYLVYIQFTSHVEAQIYHS